jgi:hypothetical protein
MARLVAMGLIEPNDPEASRPGHIWIVAKNQNGVFGFFDHSERFGFCLNQLPLDREKSHFAGPACEDSEESLVIKSIAMLPPTEGH